MRAVVTGGAGFIGSNLVDALVACGDDVVVVDDLSTGKRENVNDAARLVEADIRSADLAAAFDGAEVVYHLSGLVLGGIYEPNAAKRERMSRQAQQIIVEEAPWAFLFARDYFSPVSRNLHDYPLWPDQNPRFYWTFLT